MKTTLKLAALAAAYLLPASAFGIQIRLVDEFPYTFDVYWGEMPQAPLEDRAILSSIDKANDFAYYFEGFAYDIGPAEVEISVVEVIEDQGRYFEDLSGAILIFDGARTFDNVEFLLRGSLTTFEPFTNTPYGATMTFGPAQSIPPRTFHVADGGSTVALLGLSLAGIALVGLRMQRTPPAC